MADSPYDHTPFMHIDFFHESEEEIQRRESAELENNTKLANLREQYDKLLRRYDDLLARKDTEMDDIAAGNFRRDVDNLIFDLEDLVRGFGALADSGGLYMQSNVKLDEVRDMLKRQ